MIRLAFNLFPNMLDKSVFAFNARQSIKLISWVVLLATHIMWQTQWQCLPEISAKLFGIVVWLCGVMKIITNHDLPKDCLQH